MRQRVGQRHAIVRLLAKYLLESDHTADVALNSGGRKQQGAICTTVFLCRFDLNLCETLGDSGQAFICCENAFARLRNLFDGRVRFVRDGPSLSQHVCNNGLIIVERRKYRMMQIKRQQKGTVNLRVMR